jgi:hypothetical protein
MHTHTHTHTHIHTHRHIYMLFGGCAQLSRRVLLECVLCVVASKACQQLVKHVSSWYSMSAASKACQQHS